MGQRRGGRRNKKRRGSLKADDNQNRYANAKNQQSTNTCNGDRPKDRPASPVGETKMKDKLWKEVSLTESKQNVQENVGKNEVESENFDSNCSKSECVQIKRQYQKLLAERVHYVETIKRLNKEIQQLTSKYDQNNAGKEITMKVKTSTNHTVDTRDIHEHVAGLGDSSACDQTSSFIDRCHKQGKKEAEKGFRNHEDRHLEEVVPKNGTVDSISEKEKYVNAAVIQQYCVESVNNLTQDDCASGQQDASRLCDAKAKNNILQCQQKMNWSDPTERLPPYNIIYNWPEQNINEKRQTQDLCEARCHDGSNGSRSRDCTPQNGRRNNYVQQCEYGQQEGRENERWGYNLGQQPVRCKQVVNEIEGDLFTAPKTSSLAHCVAEDMRMGSGIAVTFRSVFKRVDELLAQHAHTGDVAVLKNEGRFIYYLVTKRQSHEKPCFEDLKSSLLKMRQHMFANNVHDVAMPRIGCGLDRLEWYYVKRLLIEIFGADDVSITVYSFNPNYSAKEITMEVDTFTRHAITSRDTELTWTNWSGACDHNNAIAKRNHKSWMKEIKEDSRNQKTRNLEETSTNCYANSMLEEEKYIRSAKAALGAVNQECWDESIDWTQGDRASCQEGASEGYEAEIILQQQEINQDDAAEVVSPNNIYNQPDQNRYNKRQDEQRQNCEYGQQQGRERERWRNNRGQQPVKHKEVVKEIEGDLFTAPKTSSLAHCVAEDMRMGSGIAVTFRQMFKRVDELQAQRVRTGAVAVLEDEGRFIYYLVTKKQSNSKPKFEDLRSALLKMRQHILTNNVHDVVMPRIACGLDRLEWRDVKSLLIEIFKKDDVNITVYNFNQGWGKHRHSNEESSRDSSSSENRQNFKAKMKSKDAEKKQNKKKNKKKKKNKHKQGKKHK